MSNWMSGPANPRASEGPTVHRMEHRCMHRSNFDRIWTSLKLVNREAPEEPLLKHRSIRPASVQLQEEGLEMLHGPKLHAVAPVEPMLWRRFIRQPSDAPVAVGVTVGDCSRDDAETEPRRLKKPVEPMQVKTGRRFNRWLRKFAAGLQTLLLIQISKTKAINTQFGPFSRDNLTLKHSYL